MGNNRPVKTKDWLAFLAAHNCKYLRTNASHDHYKCPGCWRTITHREKDKDIPPAHLRTNLATMGRHCNTFILGLRKIAKKTLQKFWEKYPNSKQQLLSWYQVFDKNIFDNPNDIKAVFGSADFVGENKVIFNICGNHYRLIVKVNYVTKIVYILVIGTHSEYDNLKNIRNL